MNTHGMVVDFGKHKGQLWTRVPVSYLLWFVNAPPFGRNDDELATSNERKAIAQAELARRGTTLPEVEISGHAIDSASLRVRRIWHQLRNENEGLHSWLCRMALEAKMAGIRDNKDQAKIHYQGVAFVFEQGSEFPIIKTIMRSKVRHEDWALIDDKDEIEPEGEA